MLYYLYIYLSLKCFIVFIGDCFHTSSSGIHKENGMKFSTKDNDNDNTTVNCAESYSSGWWHSNCYNCNLNVYNDLYVPLWRYDLGGNSLKTSIMMISKI